MKITVGLPTYDGKIAYKQVDNLLAENTLAVRLGHTLTVRFLPSCTNLAKGRNQLVKEFLASGDDRLVFLDGDVTFSPGEILKIATHPVEMVGGAYRMKRIEERYPIQLLNEPRDLGPNGIVEVAMVPTGFLALSRSVFDKFREGYPGREYTVEGKRSYCYFQIPYSDGALYTEDVYFCKEWRAIGGKVYLDPNLTLTHWDGNIPFQGNIGKTMARIQNEEPQRKSS